MGKVDYIYNQFNKGKYISLPLNGWLVTDYDKNGKLIHTKHSNGSWKWYDYDGDILVEYEDSDGNWWSLEFFPNIKCPFI